MNGLESFNGGMKKLIKGIGIDLVDLERMESVNKNQKNFYKYILTAKEVKLYKKRNKKGKLEFLAGRFAVKEAFSKAMGTGIGKKVNFQNITVINNKKGQPIIIASPFDGNIFLSISHTKSAVIAQVLLEKIN